MQRGTKINPYWTKERITEEAHKYNSRKEFREKCPSGYSVGWSMKIIESFDWLNPKPQKIESLQDEEWKDIDGWEGVYQVSNKGRVKSLSRTVQFGHTIRPVDEKILSQKIRRDGYYEVSLNSHGKGCSRTVHSLVSEAFIYNDDPEHKTQVSHKDELKTNNCVDNLEWVTPLENNNMPLHIKRLAKSQCRRKRPVKQYTLSGEYITTYNSLRDAAKHIGCSEKSISQMVRGIKNTAGGYIWKDAS